MIILRIISGKKKLKKTPKKRVFNHSFIIQFGIFKIKTKIQTNKET